MVIDLEYDHAAKSTECSFRSLGSLESKEKLVSYGRSCLSSMGHLRGQIFLLIILHTIGVRYRAAGSSRLKKHESLTTDVISNRSTNAEYVEQSCHRMEQLWQDEVRGL